MMIQTDATHKAPDQPPVDDGSIEYGPTDWGCTPIPLEVEHCEPGIRLAVLLSTIDTASLSCYDQITVLQARQRMANFYAAQVLDDVCEIVDKRVKDRVLTTEHSATVDAAAEITVALSLTRTAGERKVALALDVRDRLPAIGTLLGTGAIDERRASAICDATMHLTDDQAQAVVAHIMDTAPQLTTGQLRARIRKLCITADPDDAHARYEAAVASRRITTAPSPDGTGHLYCLDLPPDQLQLATRRINAMAKTLRRKGETRTMDQLRADVLLDLLTGRSTSVAGTTSKSGTTARQGTVDIRVDLETLAKLNDNPGHLGGYGPVIADIARQTVEQQADTEHRFCVTDDDGRPVAVGVTRKRSLSVKQRRIVQILRPTCAFPGCRMPATESDIDHIVNHADGGPATIPNSAPLCRHHNVVKQAGWHYRILPNRGYRWMSPSGHRVIKDPDP
ncbi:MAG: HNH endonuclease [Acidimicrobiia bacterium]|nr:HNH endonuclease [Acidimicrobiia bacterium]